MIKDNIRKAENYFDLSERVKLGLKYLANTDFSNIKSGKYRILDDEVFAIVQDYELKPEAECKFEAHRKYIDIQYIIDGEERIGVCDIENFSQNIEYDNEKDIAFLTLKPGGNPDFINLKEKEFAIFMPKDAHMPSIEVEMPKYVKKVVVKAQF